MMKRKMSKQKRNQLILVVAGTVAVLALLGFGLIKAQFDNLRSLAQREVAAEAQLAKMEDAIKRSDLVESVQTQAAQALAEQESQVASGDLYAWMLGTVRTFLKGYRFVELPQLSPVSQPARVTLLPDFPYQQASMTVSGKAYYHDLGRFIADFENTFPLIRVQNLSVDRSPSPTPNEREKLAFRMDLVALVKTAN